jgi:hypothetical protein
VPVTVVHPSEDLAGFNLLTLLSTTPTRTRRLITAGYRDAKRELTRRARARVHRRPPDPALREVEPAFRHEIA